MNTTQLLDAITAAAREAGAVIMDIYRGDFAVDEKADASPVTEADRRAEDVITARLRALTPDIPIVGEEAFAAGDIPAVDRRFWLVDPLDGTKEFIKRRDEFTGNIALIENATPVLGVVHSPALGLLFAGAVGGGARLTTGDGAARPIATRALPPEGLAVVASRSHANDEALAAWLEGRGVASTVKAGSSLKFCRVAEGAADVYPRFGPTMEWDTAAGHAVLLAAGGQVTTIDGAPFTYGKPGFRNPHFVAWSGAAFEASGGR